MTPFRLFAGLFGYNRPRSFYARSYNPMERPTAANWAFEHSNASGVYMGGLSGLGDPPEHKTAAVIFVNQTGSGSSLHPAPDFYAQTVVLDAKGNQISVVGWGDTSAQAQKQLDHEYRKEKAAYGKAHAPKRAKHVVVAAPFPNQAELNKQQQLVQDMKNAAALSDSKLAMAQAGAMGQANMDTLLQSNAQMHLAFQQANEKLQQLLLSSALYSATLPVHQSPFGVGSEEESPGPGLTSDQVLAADAANVPAPLPDTGTASEVQDIAAQHPGIYGRSAKKVRRVRHHAPTMSGLGVFGAIRKKKVLTTRGDNAIVGPGNSDGQWEWNGSWKWVQFASNDNSPSQMEDRPPRPKGPPSATPSSPQPSAPAVSGPAEIQPSAPVSYGKIPSYQQLQKWKATLDSLVSNDVFSSDESTAKAAASQGAKNIIAAAPALLEMASFNPNKNASGPDIKTMVIEAMGGERQIASGQDLHNFFADKSAQISSGMSRMQQGSIQAQAAISAAIVAGFDWTTGSIRKVVSAYKEGQKYLDRLRSFGITDPADIEAIIKAYATGGKFLAAVTLASILDAHGKKFKKHIIVFPKGSGWPNAAAPSNDQSSAPLPHIPSGAWSGWSPAYGVGSSVPPQLSPVGGSVVVQDTPPEAQPFTPTPEPQAPSLDWSTITGLGELFG